MSIDDVIRQANTAMAQPGDGDLPGDPRWQAVIAVGEHIPTDPDAVWHFLLHWASTADSDLHAALATCLLEHLLEQHFDTYFPQVERLAISDRNFADIFRMCWAMGEADVPANRERFDGLLARINLMRNGTALRKEKF